MNALIERLKRHESLALKVYRDRDKWAIGYGHQCPQDHPQITIEQANEYLLADIYHASDCLTRFPFTTNLSITRREVCVELMFWIGCTGFKNFTRMNKALNCGDWKLAALELYNSELGKDPTLRGRARELAELMWEGEA